MIIIICLRHHMYHNLGVRAYKVLNGYINSNPPLFFCPSTIFVFTNYPPKQCNALTLGFSYHQLVTNRPNTYTTITIFDNLAFLIFRNPSAIRFYSDH